MKYLLGSIAVVAIAAMFLYALWMPFPDTPARDAIGTEKSIDRDGRTFSYYVSGTGRPVILLASAGREASDSNELVMALNGAGHRTIAIEAQK